MTTIDPHHHTSSSRAPALSSFVSEPSTSSLRSHVTTHQLLTSILPSSSSLAEQIAALKQSHAASQRRYDKSRQHAHQELQRASSSLRGFRERLDELPGRIDSLDDDLDGVKQEVTQRRPGLEKHLGAVHSLSAADDYYALLARCHETTKACLAAPLDAKALDCLADLANLCQYAHTLCSSSSSSSSLPSQQPRLLTFLDSQLNSAYDSLVTSRTSALRDALKEAKWPPFSPEQAEAQGKAPQSPDTMLLGSASVKRAWDALVSLQVVGGLLNIKPLPSIIRGNDEQHTPTQDDVEDDDGARLTPGLAAYTPLLATSLLLEPYLLRFRYHFDSSQPTNRLDKPEWYLDHVISLVRTLAPLYAAQAGPASRLSKVALHRYGKSMVEGGAEGDVVHVLLAATRAKLRASMPLLLEAAASATSSSSSDTSTTLLGHTITSLAHFDDSLDSYLAESSTPPAARLCNEVLSNPAWFDAWLTAEQRSCERTLDVVLEEGDAWVIVSQDEADDDDEELDGNDGAAPREGSWASSLRSTASGSPKTTRSARSLVALLTSLTTRHASLPPGALELKQQLLFLSRIHLPLLRSYAVRLTRSLDAFESLSGAFARSLPGGGIDAATGVVLGGGGGGEGGGEESMVRGLRGLGRLLKAMLSARQVHDYLEKEGERSFWLGIGADLAAAGEGADGEGLKEMLQRQRDEAEERELDAESLGGLIRKIGGGGQRGQADGGAATSHSSTAAGQDTAAPNNVFSDITTRYHSLITRAQSAIQRLVVTEVGDALLREYAQSDWLDESPSSSTNADEDGIDDSDSSITPTLLPSLSLLHTHLSHFYPTLSSRNSTTQSRQLYRGIAQDLSRFIVKHVVMAGGSRRFSERGAGRFKGDWERGWRAVAGQIVAGEGGKTSTTATEGPWRFLRDVATLLALPSATSTNSTPASTTTTAPSSSSSAEEYTLSRAMRVLWQASSPEEWKEMCEALDLRSAELTGNVGTAREVVRRRVECLLR